MASSSRRPHATSIQQHVGRTLALVLSLAVAASLALPTSVLEDLITNDVTNKKVKRAQSLSSTGGEKPSLDSQKEYFFPTAIKRGGGGLKTNQLPLLTEWDQQRYREQAAAAAAAEALPPSLYNDDTAAEKTVGDYEKGYRYALNRDQLDEALENAILKSEMYGEPTYHPGGGGGGGYYNAGDRKRKRRNAASAKRVVRAQKARRLSKRLKRDTELSPEEILAILTLWENERVGGGQLRQWPSAIQDTDDTDGGGGGGGDEDWFEGPVYPHASDEHLMAPPNPNYYYDASAPSSQQGQQQPQYYYEKRKQPSWGARNKRFMVAKKRGDPTRELRYLNGPPAARVNNYYALSELLAANNNNNNNQNYML